MKKGEMSREDAKVFLNELVERGQEGRENIKNMIQSELSKFKNSEEFITKTEFQELLDRIENLEKAIHHNEE